MSSAQPSLVGYILTRNEEDNIGRAVSSLLRAADKVVVIDSESIDRTADVAKELGATVLVHPFEDFSRQRNWALEQIERLYDPDWVLALDADEWLNDELILDIRERRYAGQLDADVYLLRLRIRFAGRCLRWGGFANTRLPRLARAGTVHYEERQVNEHMVLPARAKLGELRGFLEHADVASWEHYISKHNRYSTLEARARHSAVQKAPTASLYDALRLPYLRRRYIREHLFNRIPGRPALRFVQIYLLCGGLLDGRAGFRRALFEAWQEMCTDLKAEALIRSDGTDVGA